MNIIRSFKIEPVRRIKIHVPPEHHILGITPGNECGYVSIVAKAHDPSVGQETLVIENYQDGEAIDPEGLEYLGSSQYAEPSPITLVGTHQERKVIIIHSFLKRKPVVSTETTGQKGGKLPWGRQGPGSHQEHSKPEEARQESRAVLGGAAGPLKWKET